MQVGPHLFEGGNNLRHFLRTMCKLAQRQAKEAAAVQVFGHRAQAGAVGDAAVTVRRAFPREAAGAVSDAVFEQRQQMQVLVAAHQARHTFGAAIQSNEVYLPLVAPRHFGFFGSAVDKRFALNGSLTPCSH